MANADDIFERIIESLNQTRKNSMLFPWSSEDYVAPILDYTSEVFTNPDVEYNHVHLVCCDSTQQNNPKMPSRRWSRSRSIVSNSLMSCIGGLGESSGEGHSGSITEKSGCMEQDSKTQASDLEAKAETDAFVLPLQCLHCNHKCSKSSCDPECTHTCEKCTQELMYQQQRSSISPSIDTYIDFYSYADMLNSEIAEGFRSDSQIQMDKISCFTDSTCDDLTHTHFSTISVDDYINGIANEDS